MSATPILTGKVREIYDVGDDLLLLVASDRVSAFDVVMSEPIPHKGRVLTAMSAFWCERVASVAPSHFISADPGDYMSRAPEIRDLRGRATLARKAEMLPVECVVRGYLAGSGWKEYRTKGTVCDVALPRGLVEADRLREPIFTPTTKATEGHDEAISFEGVVARLGASTAERVRAISIDLYAQGAALAEEKGILIADTKFELGWIGGELAVCDEVLTPDSSRFWPADQWRPGSTPPSFDKQPLRDWLETSGWDMKPPPPRLPPEVVSATSERYVAAYELLTGRSFASWPGVS